ncbi:hypothetical protein HDA36_000104 [Nocardiopsis composta]|uniref:Uncharacterized protein n=1 Tax=Nocardiopsis composta TaxID=157465 RepID=A0A7W8QHW4_9ACTN|nr:hypothetical protein [Nocardiopsis composta]
MLRCGHEDVLAATALCGVPAGTVLHVGEARVCPWSPMRIRPCRARPPLD